ncbi:histidine phosphatase family protein [Vulcanococcus sp.]|jgi:probable phosphoglycerate mutase|uniref:histidine phosphatase family protein n=1 Tax=Vulcanococcus sp. TaxID=2856995 RepID=UPI0037D9C3F9
MGTPELWLLRHGATAWAQAGRHTSHTDLPLLPEGEAEARALAPLLAQQPFTAVLCSPLQRARRTCELAGLAASAEITADLKEWDYGDYEGITTAEIRRTVPDWTVFSHPCPGGESPAQVQQRCERVITRGLALAGDDGRVALFAHGHLLRCLAGCWLGLGVQGGALLVLGTANVSVLGFERQQRALLRWNAPVPAWRGDAPGSQAPWA